MSEHVRRLEEWTEFLYQQHLSRTGTRPTVTDAEKIKSALRKVAKKLIDGDTATFAALVEKYGNQRQGPPERNRE